MANRRKYKPKGGRLTEPVKTTVTKEQLKDVLAAAYRANMTLAAWLRGVALRAAQRSK